LRDGSGCPADACVPVMNSARTPSPIPMTNHREMTKHFSMTVFSHYQLVIDPHAPRSRKIRIVLSVLSIDRDPPPLAA